jgi:hypothetical protein
METKCRGLRINPFTQKKEWVYGYLMNMHDKKRLFLGTWKNIGGEATIKDELFSSYVEVKSKTVTLFTGFSLDDQDLYEKDIIRFNYEDECEPNGIGYCIGIIEFENGAFVIKEIGFDNYDWEKERPSLLYDWLRDNDCELIGNVFENKELLK